MRQSTAPLPNFTHSTLRWTWDVYPGHYFHVRLVSGSQLSESVSPEEYRIPGFLGDHFSAICVFDVNAGSAADTYHASVAEALGENSAPFFYVKGGLRQWMQPP